MSFYSMIFGANPLTIWLIPMLGDTHPEELPRFRDCFLRDKEHPEYDDHIHLYTRVGGNNRGEQYGERLYLEHPNFVATFDDSFDNTYASYIFSAPDEWKEDFQKILDRKFVDVSEDLQNKMRLIFPKIEHVIDDIFIYGKPAAFRFMVYRTSWEEAFKKLGIDPEEGKNAE